MNSDSKMKVRVKEENGYSTGERKETEMGRFSRIKACLASPVTIEVVLTILFIGELAAIKLKGEEIFILPSLSHEIFQSLPSTAKQSLTISQFEIGVGSIFAAVTLITLVCGLEAMHRHSIPSVCFLYFRFIHCPLHCTYLLFHFPSTSTTTSPSICIIFISSFTGCSSPLLFLPRLHREWSVFSPSMEHNRSLSPPLRHSSHRCISPLHPLHAQEKSLRYD